MPPALKPKSEVLAALTGCFRALGYDGATLSRLSQATGLVRASLYHHFPKGKQDMAQAVLDEVRRHCHTTVIAPLQARPPGRESLEAFARDVVVFYDRGHAACLLEVFTLGSARELFGDTIQATLAALRAQLSATLRAMGQAPPLAEQKARQGVALIQGALILARGENNAELFAQTMAELPDLLTADAPDG